MKNSNRKLSEYFSNIFHNKNNEEGIAIIIALGFLSLMAILALTFATTTAINRKAAKSNNDLACARILAESVVNRAMMGMETFNGNLSDLASIYSGNATTTPINELIEKEDLYKLLPTKVNDIDYYKLEDYNLASIKPTWEYIKIDQDGSGVSKIFGRIAFVVSNHNGSLTMSAAVDNIHPTIAKSEYDSVTSPPMKTGTAIPSGADISGRPGVNVNEVWLGSLGLNVFTDEQLKLLSSKNAPDGQMPITGWGNKDNFFDTLGITDPVKKNNILKYFSFGNPEDKEAFWVDSNNDKVKQDSELYHRFNIAQNITSSEITASPLPYISTTVNGGIPWINNWKTSGEMGSRSIAKNQLIANLLDYTDADCTATTDNEDNPTYVGLEKCPYINELKIEIKSETIIASEGFALWAAGSMAIQPLWGGTTTISSAHANGPIAAQGDVVFTGVMTQNSYESSPSFPKSTEDPWTQDLSYYDTNAAYSGNVNITLKAITDPVLGDQIKIVRDNGNTVATVADGSIIYIKNKNITIAENNFNRSVTLICVPHGGGDINITGNNVTITPADGNALMYSGAEIHIEGDNFTGSGVIKSRGSMKIASKDAKITNASIISLGAIAVQCAGKTNISGGEGGTYLNINDLNLELVNMYDNERTCTAEVTIDGTYDWVIDQVDSEVKFSKVYNLSDIVAPGKSYAVETYTSTGYDDTNSNISPIEPHPGAQGSTSSFENFKFTGIKVKLTDGNNLYDFSNIAFLDTDSEEPKPKEDPEDPEDPVVDPVQQYNVQGTVLINPNNSGDKEFTMTLPDGTIIDRDTLHSGGSGYYYSGPSKYIKLKSHGSMKELTVNGLLLDIHNNPPTEITSDNMTVNIVNKKAPSGSGNSKKMGQWLITINAADASITPSPGSEYDIVNDIVEVKVSEVEGVDISSAAPVNSYYFDFEIADPRQNLNTADWADGGNDHGIISNIGTIGTRNNKFTNRPTTGDVDAEPDPDVNTKLEPWEISNAYIRNAQIQSPWELGAIHRGSKWQTVNLKKYNVTEGMSGGGNSYADGDANILDQIKMTSATKTLGKINLNVTEDKILTTLFYGISTNSGYTNPGSKNNMIDEDNAKTLEDIILTPPVSDGIAIKADKKFNTSSVVFNFTT